MTDSVAPPPDDPIKRMRLRYAGTCCRCAAPLGAKEWALYDRSTKTVFCIECPVDVAVPAEREWVDAEQPADVARVDATPAPEPAAPLGVADGLAGGSALREYERRSTAREERVRTAHPKIGGLLLALVDDPQSTRAWARGAVGEQRLGQSLTHMAGSTLRVLHDRQIPKTRANIDHLVICPGGVFVVDAKRYRGRPTLRIEGGLRRPRVETLVVGGRDCSKLVDGALKQVGLVRAAVDDVEVPVQGVLCFVDADWPLIGGAFTTREIAVVWPRKLAGMLAQPGPLDATSIAAVHRQLAEAFPRA